VAVLDLDEPERMKVVRFTSMPCYILTWPRGIDSEHQSQTQDLNVQISNTVIQSG